MSKQEITAQVILPIQNDENKILQPEDQSEMALKQIIRAMNLKVTTQRIAILQSLQQGHRHVTAQELFEVVSSKFPEIGFATVYRFLRSLSESRFVTEVRMGGLPARYEMTSQAHHDHLSCTQCGCIVEFENKTIESLQEKIAQRFGFTLTHHVLELYGVCASCKEQE
jgi:Fur family transcriptional regulator, ferric uptake regulator